MRRLRSLATASFLIITVPVIVAGTTLAESPAPQGAENYASWQWQDNKQQGEVKLKYRSDVGLIRGDISAVGADADTQSGNDTWLSASTPFGAVYGSSRSKAFFSVGLRDHGDDATWGDDERETATVTYIFDDTPVPSKSWGIAFGDIDAEMITIRATGPDGRQLDVTNWYSGVFNYCSDVDAQQNPMSGMRNGNAGKPSVCDGYSGSDVPTWSAATATLTGSGHDTRGASGWFQPTEDVATLTVELTRIAGSPRFQTWIATLPGYSPPTPPEPGPEPAQNAYSVTVVARLCPTYDDVMANTQRNNKMQSLENLGANSIYPGLGNPAVSPAVEEDPATGQGACNPLHGWTFALGSGFGSADTGNFGELTPVKKQYATLTTRTETPELDDLGNPTGRTLKGAATLTVDDTQVDLVVGKGKLTAQGGIQGQPLNGTDNRAFATLRCATDNKNGDNVEFVDFPSGSRHVFCYAYYVDTTPEAGRITITKEVTGAAEGVDFQFGGNVSFTPGGGFSLRAGASTQAFERQSGLTWTVTESGTPGYDLTDIACTGAARIRTDISAATADIDLGPGDDVHCTFTNAPTVQPSANATLSISKISGGGLGTFTGSVITADGSILPWTATTVAPGSPTLALTTPISGPGTYGISEEPVDGWTTRMSCSDATGRVVGQTVGNLLPIDVSGDSSIYCTVSNTKTPTGTITVTSTVIGGTGDISALSSYRLQTNGDSAAGQSVDVTDVSWGQPVSGAFAGPLAFGDYTVTATPPANTDEGSWTLASATCTGATPSSGSPTAVTLSESAPSATCDYVYQVQSLNPTLVVSKTVSSGGELRTGPAVIGIYCDTATDPYSTSVALPPGTATITQLVTLPADTASCQAMEVATGARPGVDPGQISVTFDSQDWPVDQVHELANGVTAAVIGTSSSGAGVDQVVSGPCVSSSEGITPTRRASTCNVTFTAMGGYVTTDTYWSTPSGAGAGSVTDSFDIAPGQSYSISFINAYTGQTTSSTTSRQIQAISNPATLNVADLVPVGNDLRDEAMTVRVTCAASAAADPRSWPQFVTLEPGKTAAESTITVPGTFTNSDVCQVVQTKDGIVNPDMGKISATWNNKAWHSKSIKQLAIGDKAVVAATASTGERVAIVDSGPCAIADGRVSATSAPGECLLTFTAGGEPKITAKTTYLRTRFAVTRPGEDQRLLVVNRYRDNPRTITTKRTIDTLTVPPCQLSVSAAKTVAADGTTLLIKDVTTGEGCAIDKIIVTCTISGLGPRGDYSYCTTTRGYNSRVYVTTYGKKNVVVNAKVVAKGDDHVKAEWERTYPVKE